MLSPPDDLDQSALAAALTLQWGIAVAGLEYRPVGFGSHHWSVTGPGGGRWFVTVDDLDATRRSAAESRDDAYRRLGRALGAARALRDTGAAFVVAPLVTAGGAAVIRPVPRYAVAVYPHVDGETFDFGARPPGHGDAVLEMLLTVHAAPGDVRRLAGDDDGGIPHRDAVESALDGQRPEPVGPYAERSADLLVRRAEAVQALLYRYDRLVARTDRRRGVLTHGEPHPGNTIRTPDGWRLIDWDTVLVAPPERDLWMLGDEVAAAYEKATGVAVRPEMCELYRVRWDVADLAAGVARFRAPHTGTADDDQQWAILSRIVTELPPR